MQVRVLPDVYDSKRKDTTMAEKKKTTKKVEQAPKLTPKDEAILDRVWASQGTKPKPKTPIKRKKG